MPIKNASVGDSQTLDVGGAVAYTFTLAPDIPVNSIVQLVRLRYRGSWSWDSPVSAIDATHAGVIAGIGVAFDGIGPFPPPAAPSTDPHWAYLNYAPAQLASAPVDQGGSPGSGALKTWFWGEELEVKTNITMTAAGLAWVSFYLQPDETGTGLGQGNLSYWASVWWWQPPTVF